MPSSPFASPPYVLAFDMDDTIIRSASRGKVTRDYLIPQTVKVLMRAAELREKGIVESIFLLTNNNGIPFTSAVDSLLYEMALEDPRIKITARKETPGVALQNPKFFDAILMRKDPQRRPTEIEWPNSPKSWRLVEKDALGRQINWGESNQTIRDKYKQVYGIFARAPPYNPPKEMSNIAVMSLLQKPESRPDIDDLLSRLYFFDDFDKHHIATQLPLGMRQYIVIHPTPDALDAEIAEKLPAILQQEVGTQGGGRRRKARQTRSKRRRTTHKRSKVYARRPRTRAVPGPQPFQDAH